MAETVKLLENLLNYCTAKNRVIAKNISNIGTENYKREDVVFKDILDKNLNSSLKTDNEKHLKGISIDESSTSEFKHVYDSSEEMDSGINNVNIEKEMAELAENTLRFKFASRKVSDYYKSIQGVIKGGGSI